MRRETSARWRNIGVGIAISLGIGTALFAATSNLSFIGVGVAIGVPLGVALDQGNGEMTGRSRQLFLVVFRLSAVVLGTLTIIYFVVR